MSKYLDTGDPFLIDLWYNSTGRYYPLLNNRASFVELKTSQWSDDFEFKIRALLLENYSDDFDELIKYAKNRMIFGGLRYGLIKNQDYSKYDLIGIATRKYESFIRTDNIEYLIDCYNNIMLAYIHGKRNKESFCTANSTFGCSILSQYESSRNLYFLVVAGAHLTYIFNQAKRAGLKVQPTDDIDHGKEIVQ